MSRRDWAVLQPTLPWWETKRNYEWAVVIGRFQPFHEDHLTLIYKALEIAKRAIVLVGSAAEPRSEKNPWTWQERSAMIKVSLPEGLRDRVLVFPVENTDEGDKAWAGRCRAQMAACKIIYGFHYDNFILVGHNKDESSYYLKLFPEMPFHDVGKLGDINATDIRYGLFREKPYVDIGKLPNPVYQYIREWMKTYDYRQLWDTING